MRILQGGWLTEPTSLQFYLERRYTGLVAAMKSAVCLALLFSPAWAVPPCEGPPDLAAAIKSQPSFAPAHIALGAWFAQQKQYSCAIVSFQTALRLDATRWEAHYDLALALVASAQPLAAESHLRYALPLAPDIAQAHFHLGQVLVAQKRYTAAVPYLQEAVRQAPSRSSLLALGMALSGSGQTAEAAKTLEKLAASYPDSAEAHFTLANLYAKLEQYGDAAAAYSRTLKLDPSNDTAKLALVKSLLALFRNEEALPVVEDYISMHPRDAEALYLAGLANRRLARLTEAEAALLGAAALTPRDYKIQYNLGVVLEQLRKFDGARDHLEQAGAIRPGEAEVHFRLAAVFRGLSNEARAGEELKLFRAMKDREQQLRQAELGTHRAHELMEKGDAGAAAELYREALKLDPANINTLFDLSLALSKLGDSAGEREVLGRALAIDPQFKLAHNQLGLRHMADGQLEDARRDFQAALNADPQLAEARNNLGVLSGQQGRHAEAERMFRQAIEDDPQNVKARVNVCLILAAMGRLADAESEIKAAIRIAPGDEGAKKALAAIQTAQPR